jgi:L-phenylalanine/L-methionine N-acetyltransferase
MDVTIRPVRPDDADAINAIRREPGVIETTLGTPSERIEVNREFIEALGDADHYLVAEVDGRLAGFASLREGKNRQRHTARLGIIVGREFQGRGIGRALMRALVDIADNYLKLVRVELDVVADNARAIKLYESFGFEVEGRKRKDAIRDGEYVDCLLMARINQS